MTVFESVLLGFIQGLTEFLPVSSSGHLVMAQMLLGLKEPMLAFDIMLHLGTLVAVLIYFFRDIWQMIVQTLAFLAGILRGKRKDDLTQQYPFALLSGFLIVSTLVTGIIGVFLKDFFEAMFASILWIWVGWLITGAVLIWSVRLQGRRKLDSMNNADAFSLGIFQAVSIIPSISRSGATIVGGMLLGFEKADAARFSFLMSIPAILGAAVLEIKDIASFESGSLSVYAAGFLVSGVVGYLSIAWLLSLTQRGKFHYFGYYCIAAGFLTLIYSIVSGNLR